MLILLVLAFRGCLNARNERAIKDYVSQSSELIDQSKLEGNQLFELLSGSGDQDDAVDAANVVNGLRSESTTLVDRAHDLDTPDEVSAAQDNLVDALELRRDGLAAVANALPGALADEEQRESTGDVAEVMQVFLASDVLLKYRFRPNLQRALEEEDLTGEVSVPRPRELEFVPDVQWADPDFVADQVAGLRGGGGGAGDEPAAPGLHGNGLGTVTLGGVALVPGASATVPLADDLSFDVQVVNQGENNETDVNVTVTVGEGNDADVVEEQIPEIAVGEQQTVTIPLGSRPPTGENVAVTVEVEPVAGEEMTDNNVAEFTVIFTS
ncbi:MAG TPA: CARDB domain-containing protein [Thermoleophilaceae bacterium]|nr:CARDB domain-containing protein [Thermoleophilaceae bacterium]